jgi:hypothetical protein
VVTWERGSLDAPRARPRSATRRVSWAGGSAAVAAVPVPAPPEAFCSGWRV